MTRGYLVVTEPEQLYVRAVCNWVYVCAGFYHLDFGAMVALRWSGRLNLEIQFGWFQAAISLGAIPDQETIQLLLGDLRKGKANGRQEWNPVDPE